MTRPSSVNASTNQDPLMARKKKREDGAADGDESASNESAGTKKSNLVPAIVIAIGLILGAKMMGGSGTGSAATAETTTTTVVARGPVVKLAPITLNLTDGRFLRVGIAFQKVAEPDGAAGEGTEHDPSDAVGHYAKALDIVIRVLGAHTYEELVAPEGRKATKSKLITDLKTAYPDDIEDLYFTEFVLQ